MARSTSKRSGLRYMRKSAVDSVEAFQSSSPALEIAPERALRGSFFRDVPWKWTDVLICFAPDAAFLLGMALRVRPVLRAPRWFFLPSVVLFELWMLACPFWIARRRLGTLPRLPGLRAVLRESRWLVAFVPIFLGTMIATYFAIVGVLGEDAVPPNGWEPIARASSRAEQIGLALLGISLAPVAEEVCFRGMLYNKLRQRLPMVVAAALQGALFGLLHHFGLAQSFIIGVIGFGLAAVYEWCKTLVAPVLLHASINGVATALLALNIAADATAPRLGVFGEPRGAGVTLTDIAPGSSADQSGLRVGDVVTAIDGMPIPDMRRMTQIVRSRRVGDKITIEFSRDEKTEQIVVELAPLPSG